MESLYLIDFEELTNSEKALDSFVREIEKKVDPNQVPTVLFILPPDSSRWHLYAPLFGILIESFSLAVPLIRRNPRNYHLARALVDPSTSLREVYYQCVLFPRLHFLLPFYDEECLVDLPENVVELKGDRKVLAGVRFGSSDLNKLNEPGLGCNCSPLLKTSRQVSKLSENFSLINTPEVKKIFKLFRLTEDEQLDP